MQKLPKTFPEKKWIYIFSYRICKQYFKTLFIKISTFKVRLHTISKRIYIIIVIRPVQSLSRVGDVRFGDANELLTCIISGAYVSTGKIFKEWIQHFFVSYDIKWFGTIYAL